MNLTDHQLVALIGAAPFLILSCVWAIGHSVIARAGSEAR